MILAIFAFVFLFVIPWLCFLAGSCLRWAWPVPALILVAWGGLGVFLLLDCQAHFAEKKRADALVDEWMADVRAGKLSSETRAWEACSHSYRTREEIFADLESKFRLAPDDSDPEKMDEADMRHYASTTLRGIETYGDSLIVNLTRMFLVVISVYAVVLLGIWGIGRRYFPGRDVANVPGDTRHRRGV